MPAPDTDQVEAFRVRVCSGIDAGLDDPFSLLSEHVDDMVALIEEAPARAVDFESAVRQHALSAGRSQTSVNRLSLSRYRDEARARRRREEEQRRTVIQAAARFTEAARAEGGGRRQRRTYDEVREQSAAMTPDQMIDSDSLYLIAAGHLRKRRTGRIWFDSFRYKHVTDWSGAYDDSVIPVIVVSDEFERRVHGWLCEIEPRMAKASLKLTENAIRYVAEMDQRNALQDWIGTLTWDGEYRLSTLLHRAYGTPNDDYHTAVGRNWFLSMAARMKWPGCRVHTMPVLMGPQGIYKSQSLEIIGGQWYAASVSEIGTEKFRQELQGCVVFEIPELHSFVSSRVGASHIKAVLSTAVDRFRPAFAHNVGEFKRTAVLVGTTNDRGWHNDDTGGRRFWPIICGEQIDLEWLRDNRDQLFAEAKAAIDNGDSWWEVPVEEQERKIEAERSVDPFEEIIEARLTREPIYGGEPGETLEPWDGTVSEHTAWGNLLTVNRIGISWMKMTPEMVGRNAKRIAGALRKLDFVSTQARVPGQSKPVRFWLPNPIGGDVANGGDFMTDSGVRTRDMSDDNTDTRNSVENEAARVLPELDDDIPF